MDRSPVANSDRLDTALLPERDRVTSPPADEAVHKSDTGSQQSNDDTVALSSGADHPAAASSATSGHSVSPTLAASGASAETPGTGAAREHAPEGTATPKAEQPSGASGRSDASGTAATPADAPSAAEPDALRRAAPASAVAQPAVEPEPSKAAPPATLSAPPASAVPVPAGQRGGTILLGVLALVSVVAAGAAITAPHLRQELAALSSAWFGTDHPVATWLGPADTAHVEHELAALLPRIAQLEAGLAGVTGEIRRLERHLADAGSTLHEGLGSIDTIARTAEEAMRRSTGAEAASRLLADRVRAAGLLAVATRLRRDVDVGAPLTEAAMLLSLYGPYPPAIEQAVADLTRLPDGPLSMRGLATGYEALEAQIAAQAELDMSWSSRSWNRMRWLLGGGPADTEAAILARLHDLAADGRFNETADLLERSPWKETGAAWIGQVRDRTRAVLAAQAIMAHAVATSRATLAGGGDLALTGAAAKTPGSGARP